VRLLVLFARKPSDWLRKPEIVPIFVKLCSTYNVLVSRKSLVVGKNVLRTAVLGDKGKSLEIIVLENNDKSLGTTILADKYKGIETTVFKTLEIENYCARR
jgi:hypothetical protein